MTPKTILGGLGVEQYAGVTAALAEGFALDQILANEQLDPALWHATDSAWKRQLAIDGVQGGSLFNAYRAKREVAEDCLARKVAPLEEDLAAWLSFLDAWAKSPEPDAMLSRSGLNTNDLSRLKRRWSKRMEEDRARAVEAAKLAAQGEKPMPTITVAAAMLRPFPWSKRGEVKAAVAQAPVAVDVPVDVSLDQYARMCAELALVSGSPIDEVRLLERHGMNAASYAAVDSQWQVALASNSELAADHRRLVAHHRVRLEAAAKPVAQQPDGLGAAAPYDTDRAAAEAPAPAADARNIKETALLAAAFIPALAAEDALPFGWRREDASGSNVGEKALVGALTPKNVLPFSGDAPATPAAATHAPADHAMRGGTAQVDSNVIREISEVLPFGSRRRAPDFAHWAIENYASLCAECAVRPHERPQIHARYHITDDAERATLDAYWEDKLAKDVALARRFRELMVQAGDWLRPPSSR